jgi:hypothetical protein
VIDEGKRSQPQRSQNRTHCCSLEQTLVVRSRAGVRGGRQIGMTNTQEGQQQGIRPPRRSDSQRTRQV